MTKKTNKETYVLAVGESDLERMTMLGEIYMPHCADFLFKNGLKPGLTVADVGCGPGNVSLWLAAQVGETGKVVAIDNSDEQLAIVNQRISEKQVHQLSTYKSDIYAIDQIQERFDIVFCRFLLIHLQQPLLAIRQLSKLLKPGGCLVLAEVDNATWFSYPAHEALQQDTDLLCKVGAQKGIDFCIGPKLYGYLRQENFEAIDVNIAQPVLVGKNRSYLLLKSKAWAEIYLQFGLISQTDLEAMSQSMQALATDLRYIVAGAKMYLTAGRRA